MGGVWCTDHSFMRIAQVAEDVFEILGYDRVMVRPTPPGRLFCAQNFTRPPAGLPLRGGLPRRGGRGALCRHGPPVTGHKT